ncbi:MAG: TonB-dependent receptor [Gammaproteobacteria bacterium]|nr:TonB-dependent receptor [Gammaproteobacteria bacterium]
MAKTSFLVICVLGLLFHGTIQAEEDHSHSDTHAKSESEGEQQEDAHQHDGDHTHMHQHGPSGSNVVGVPQDGVEELLVRAHPYSEIGLTQGLTELSGDDLAIGQGSSLGHTLSEMAGIHNSTYGSGVGQPVIHGLDGPRVQVLTDRLSTMDLGKGFGDHPLLADSLVADRIEVLKGATTLLYGSGSTGGVVNVESGRFPKRMPDLLASRYELRQTDNGEMTTMSFKQQFQASEDLLIHLDAYNRDSSSYDIPGCPTNDALHHDEHEEEELHDEHEEEEEPAEEEENCSVQMNSDMGMGGGSVGFSRFFDKGSIGFAVNMKDGGFGVPIHLGHEEPADGHEDEHEDEHENEAEDEHEDEHGHEGGERIELDLNQVRFDMNAHYSPQFGDGPTYSLRAGFSDYEHQELENDETATEFYNDARDIRLEIALPEKSGIRQLYGFHHDAREFEMHSGDHVVASSSSLAGFALYRFDKDAMQYELGVRLGRIAKEAEESPDRSFNSYSLSTGLLRKLDSHGQVSLNGELTSRAPSIEELYVEGAHLQTGSFELGSSDLDNERMLALSLGYHQHVGKFIPEAIVYARSFQNYIYIAETGEVHDGLPVFAYTQDEVNFIGADLSLHYNTFTENGWDIHAEVTYDMVNIRLVDADDHDRLARHPPNRIKTAFSAYQGPWSYGVSYLHTLEVDDVAHEELPTDAFGNLKAFVQYSHRMTNRNFDVSLSASNLLDEEQRLHVSRIKDRVLQRGRTLELVFRISA